MKHVGLNVAADPLFTMSYTGVGAGLVIGVADDAGMVFRVSDEKALHTLLAENGLATVSGEELGLR